MPFSTTTTVTGLKETDITVPTADTYNIIVTLETPQAQTSMTAYGAGGGAGTGTGGGPTVPSQVVIVIKQNSTTKLTSNAGDRGASLIGLSCAANDVIKVILSSSAAGDQVPAVVKATIAISEGQI